MDNITWLVIANSSKARIYSLHKARFYQTQDSRDLTLIAEYDHEASRKKANELVTDKMGRFGAGTFVEAADPKYREAEIFAHEIVEKLEMGYRDKNFRDLIVAAPATFLGLLNKSISNDLAKIITLRIEKDYTAQDMQKLAMSLQDHL